MKKSLITSFVFISLVYAPVDVFAESPFGQEPQDPVYAAEPGGEYSIEAIVQKPN
jgi:hypothetical protein